MKNISILIAIMLAYGGVLCAQELSVSSSPVKDYASFKKYVELEQSKIKAMPVTIDTGHVKGKLKKMGIDFVPSKNWATSKDAKRTAYLSPDRKVVMVADSTTHSVNIYSPEGVVLHEIPIKKIEGLLGYSETRLFDFKGGFGDHEGGFYIYDVSGKLVKKVENSGVIDVFMVSNDQKHVAVAGGGAEGDGFVALYDMNGMELWRKNTVLGGKTAISFSANDEFLVVKMPIYWAKGERKSKKLYLFRVNDGGMLSEEYYND